MVRKANGRKSQAKRPNAVIGVVSDCSSAYGRNMLRGILRYASLQQKWQLHVDTWRVSAKLGQFPQTDGAILVGADDEVFKLMYQNSRHMVCCSGSYDASRTPVISLDDKAAGAMAADHLIDCGLEHFAFYGLQNRTINDFANQRLTGFEKELQSRGFDCVVSPVSWQNEVDWMNREHRADLVAWLQSLPKPIGIMASDDFGAFDLLAACHEADLKVPDNIAVIGVNNDDLLCEAANPSISSVDVDFQRMGYEAAKLLHRMMRGKLESETLPHIKMPPLGIQQRTSTSQLTVDDKDLAAAIRYIRDHACDPCSVRDVMEHVKVTRRWLERKFVDKVGRTPYEEILRVRIEQSKRMLLQLDLSVDDIAGQCGYTATSNFNRVFRKVTGITPAVFRRTARCD